MLQVDPRVMFWFGVWTNVLVLIGSYGFDHAPAVIAQFAPTAQWVANFMAQMNSVILTAMAGASSSKAGPFIGAGK